MADNQRYYYLKLKEDFFDGDEIKVLEGMKDGYKYSNLLLKLYLKSLKFGGALRLNELIPYNVEMIASITHFDLDTVRVGLDLFKRLGLIEVLEDGTIYIMEIQNYIGKSTTEADRKRFYRAEIENQKALMSGQMSDGCPTNGGQNEDKSTPDIRDRDKSIEIKKESIEKAPDKPAHRPPNDKANTPGEYHEQMEAAEKKKFHPPTTGEITDYCRERNNRVNPERFHDFYEAKGWMVGKNKMKDWKACIRTWEQRDKAEGKPPGSSQLADDLAELERSGIFDDFNRSQ